MNWTIEEKKTLAPLRSPLQIQAFLDSIPYSTDPVYRCPHRVLRDRKAHCFDGAVLAAAALKRIGFPPRIMELKAERDDDHLLALYKIDGIWGALAKSNFSGLRFREPIHRSLRELALSYFDGYYNIAGEKTLRAYSTWIDLDHLPHPDWRFCNETMDAISDTLDAIRHFPLLPKATIHRLARMDERSYRAGLMGADEKGLFQP